MTGLEIGMLAIGALSILGSFFITSKLTGSDLSEVQKLTEKEIQILVEKKFKELESEFEKRLQEKVDHVLEETDRKTDKETNDKIMEIGEYSDTVLKSMNKSHDEVMFMYNMLNEKQEKVTELTATLQKMESEIRYMEDALRDRLSEMPESFVPLQNMEEIPAEYVKEETPLEEVHSMKEELQKELDDHSNNTNSGDISRAELNQKIIDMHNQGFSEIELAKKLGVGLGEVKLVLGLFN
jgi:uncharacterized protein YneF (UPF0154 family)